MFARLNLSSELMELIPKLSKREQAQKSEHQELNQTVFSSSSP